MRCDKCKYWIWNAGQVNSRYYDTDEDVQDGRCHRFPPVHVSQEEYNFETGQSFKWAWPETMGEEWCGEFIEAPNANCTPDE